MAGTSKRNKQRNEGPEDASKLIRENMKCPVCLEVLLPPIYQCETGHNICYLCVDEVTECPLCKSDYGDTRNYFAEELVNSMTFPCKYEEYGCHKTFLGSQLKDHQENCECQPYRCPELACQEVVGVHQMTKHLDKHGFKIMKGDAHQASVQILDDHFDRKTEYNPWRISAFGAEFYTVSTRSRDGLWYFWAYGLGLQKDMKKFSYEIVLFSDEKQIMYRGLVQSLRVSPEDIMKNGSCLITMDSVIKSIRKNGRIKCQVYFIQGKNWDVRNKKNKVKRAAKNLKKNCQKGKNKALIPNSATFTCSKLITSSLTSQTPLSSNLVTPHCSRSRVLHNNVKISAVDILRKEHGSSVIGPGSSSAGGSYKSFKSKSLTLNTKRSLSRTTATVSEEEDLFVLKIRETLRCPGCNETITPPVFQCLIGHNVCHKCKVSRQDCALCRAPLGDCRNFFAEELLYKTFQRCPYSRNGCKVCLPSAQMRSHEAICEFAPFECPFNVCRTMLNADDLFEHLQTHQITVVDKELKNQIDVPRNAPAVPVCSIPNILTVEKVPFYPIVVRDTDGSWLFYVISQNYASYRYELMIKKQSKTIAFQGPVLSLRTNYSQVKQRGLALVTTEKTVKNFKAYDKLEYVIKIDKCGNNGRDSGFNLPSSWVLLPKGTEVVSKTELFANKKTSVSPNEESDDEDTVSLPRNATENSSVYISETEDFETESEMTSEGEISVGKGDESEYDSEVSHSERKKVSAKSNDKILSQTQLGAASDNTASIKALEVVAKARYQSNSPSPAYGKSKSSTKLDVNNNNIIVEEHDKNCETSSNASSCQSKSEKVSGQLSDVRSEDSIPCNLPVLRTAVPSVHNLKLSQETPLTTSKQVNANEPVPERKRSRSMLKHRVRLSEDVINRDTNGSANVVKAKFKASKSQAGLYSTSNKPAALKAAASKHFLTVQVRDDGPTIENEFDKLKQAIQACPNGELQGFEEVGDLIAVKSLNGVSDAISAVNDAVNGGFDVVRSVISLFTSEKADKCPDNSNDSITS